MARDEVLPKRDLRHRDGVLGPLAGGGRAHERLVRMLEQAVRDVQVALGHRDVHRLADDAAGEVHGRGQVRELVELVQIVEGAVAAPVVEVEHERGAVGRHEQHVAPADGDAALGVARREGEGLRRLRDQLHEQRAVDAHAPAVDVGAGLLPESDRLLVPEVDPDLFEDPHRGVMDAFESFLVEHLVARQRELQRRQHRRLHADPRAMSGRASPGSDLSGSQCLRSSVSPLPLPTRWTGRAFRYPCRIALDVQRGAHQRAALVGCAASWTANCAGGPHRELRWRAAHELLRRAVLRAASASRTASYAGGP